MIPINIEDPVVLRRTLEDLASGSVRVETPISGLAYLEFVPTRSNEESIQLKMNEMIDTINAISSLLNATSTKFNS